MRVWPPLLLSLLLGTNAHATMYKWVDEEGNVTYSQNPPPGREAEEIAPPPPPPTPVPSQQEDSADETDSPETMAAKKAETYRRNCEAARQNLQIYQKHSTILVGDTEVTLSEEEKAKRIEETRKQIDLYCTE